MRFWSTKPVLALLIAGTVSVFACRDDDTVTVLVDNGDSANISVSVNGSSPLHIAPGERRKLTCHSGEAIFAIFREGENPRIESHYLRKGNSEIDRCYLLNPDRSRFYMTANIDYGSGERQKIVDLALSSGVLTEQQRRNVLYHRFQRKFRLLPMTGWHDISEADCRFRRPPEQLVTSSRCDQINALQSIPRDLYCRITATTGKHQPSLQDCHQLAQATHTTLSTF